MITLVVLIIIVAFLIDFTIQFVCPGASVARAVVKGDLGCLRGGQE